MFLINENKEKHMRTIPRKMILCNIFRNKHCQVKIDVLSTLRQVHSLTAYAHIYIYIYDNHIQCKVTQGFLEQNT